ncbi:cobalamin biosynthesis protein CobG, partial [Streptomyces sp. NPDC003327]
MPPTPPPPPEPGEPRIRDRGDACPGALRLHPADDGRLARLRLPGGRLTAHQAVVLAGAAETLGDGRVSITSRGNAELRGLGEGCGAELAALLDGAGLLPSPTHERVRNIVASPAAGLDGNGHADVQLWARDLDALLCADPRAAALSGRFLFALDDGRADVAALGADVTLIAVPAATGVAESSGSSTGVGGTAAAGGGGTGPGAEAESPAEAEAAGPAREAGAAAVSGRAAAEAGGSAQAGGAAQAGVAAEAGPSTEAASAASASEAGAAAVSGRAAAEAGGSARAGGAAQAGPPTEAASAASASEAGVTAQAGVTAEAGPPTEAASAGPVEAPGADAAAAPTGGARPVCDALLRVGAQVFRVSGEDAARAAVVAALAFLDAARVAGNGAWRVRELPEGHPLDLAGALARAGVAAEPVRESTGTSTVTEHLGAGAVPGPNPGPPPRNGNGPP